MVALNSSTLAKLGKLLPLLASDHDGEVVAAARSITRVLEANGASFHDLVLKLTTTERPLRTNHPGSPATSAPARSTPKAKAQPKPTPAEGLTAAEVKVFAPILLRDPALSDWDRETVEGLAAQARRSKSRFDPFEASVDQWRNIISRHGLEETVTAWAAT